MTREELQLNIQTEVNTILENASKVIKEYVDGRDSALKSELQQAIVDELSGIEGLNEDLEKLKSLAEAFASVFDENEDGTVTAEEIVAKLALLQSNIDKVAQDVAKNATDITSLRDALEQAVKDLVARIDALEINVSKNADKIAQVEANLTTNYFTKEDVSVALTLNVDEAVEKVRGVFFPETSDSDGAVE